MNFKTSNAFIEKAMAGALRAVPQADGRWEVEYDAVVITAQSDGTFTVRLSYRGDLYFELDSATSSLTVGSTLTIDGLRGAILVTVNA